MTNIRLYEGKDCPDCGGERIRNIQGDCLCLDCGARWNHLTPSVVPKRRPGAAFMIKGAF